MYRKILTVVAVVCLAVLVAAGSALAAGTTAGADIANKATATYRDKLDHDMPSADSNTVHTTVSAKYGVSLAVAPNPPATNDGAPGDYVVFTLTLTNNANTTDDFTTTAVAHQSGAFTLQTPTYYKDALCTTVLLNSDLAGVAADGTVVFYMKGQIPSSATDTQTSTDRCRVTSVGDSGQTAYVDPISRAIEGHVTLGKAVDNANPEVGDIIMFTITATSDGTDAGSIAKSVSVSDDLTNMLTIATFKTNTLKIDGAAQSDPGSFTPMTVSLGDMAKGTTHTITFQMTIKSPLVDGSNATNTASVTYGPGSKTGTPPPSPPTVTVKAPKMDVIKSVDKANAKPGETLTYTIEATNIGQSNATAIVVTDILNALPVTYVNGSASASTNGGGTTSSSYNSGTKTVTGQVDSLPPTKKLTVTFQVTIN